MNAADLARLELAKRAHRATEPNPAEVQRGVRKARLGLQRPRARSTWLTRTVVAGVLAMGGLAYAKPHALGEMVQSALHAASGTSTQGVDAGSAAPAVLTPPRAGAVVAGPAQAPAAAIVSAPSVAAEPSPEPARAVKTVKPAAASTRAPAKPPAAAHGASATSDGKLALAAAAKEPEQEVSDWGRVGAALAGGDESRALAVLSELSESDDRRTRDKAELGRAQLMMSNGNRDQACAIARGLTNRGAGSRIERQAQALLKSCAR